jgi:hypothetical protein
MGIDVTAEVVIRRPVDEVAAWVMDPANDLGWIRALTDSHRVGDVASGAGLRVSRTAKMMGRPMTYVTEVVESDARMMKMQTIDGPFPMVVTYLFDAAGDGSTRVRVRNQGGKGLMFTIFRPFIGWMVNSRVKGDLKQMKRVLEAG